MDGSTGLDLSNPAAAAMDQNLLEHKVRLEGQLKGAAGWFFWIAGLSLINSVIVLFGGQWHFILGLGITTFFDGVALHLNSSVANLAVFVINVIILGVPVLFGVFARKGQKWAFIVGMVLYALDGVLLVLFQLWLSAAFHVYALFMIYRGVTAIPMLQQVRQAMAVANPTPDPIEP